MDVDTDALRWFQQVADGVTVTEAAEFESISQSGMSRALARLDDEIGTPLLRRSGRVLRLTRAGAAFKRHVDAMLHELDDGRAAVAQAIAPDTGTVTVAFQLSLGAWLVPGLVAGFRQQHPQVQFDLRQTRDELITSTLDGGDVDVELTTLRPERDDLTWTPLLVEPLRLAEPGSEAGEGATGTVRLADYAGTPFVTLRRTYLLREITEQICARAGFTPTIAFEGDDVSTVRGFVAAGLGVAILPAAPPQPAPTGAAPLRYRTIADDGAYRRIGMASSRDRPLLAAAERFRQYVADDARRLFPGLTG